MIIGVDIGRKNDHTALIMMEGWQVVDLQILPLGLQHHDINDLIRAEIKSNDVVYIDQTGVGDSTVCELRRTNASQINGVHLTGGDAIRSIGESTWYISKSKLLALLDRAIRETLIINLPTDKAIALKEQLTGMITHPNKTVGARLGQHDDAVIALALAVFGKIVD
jgi:hypothetical protein